MNCSPGDKGEQHPGGAADSPSEQTGAPVAPRISTVVVWGPLLQPLFPAPRVLLVPVGSEDSYVQAFAGAVAVGGDPVVPGPVVTGPIVLVGGLVGGAAGAAVGAGLAGIGGWFPPVPFPIPWPIPPQEPCAGGRLLVRHVFWDCRAGSGT